MQALSKSLVQALDKPWASRTRAVDGFGFRRRWASRKGCVQALRAPILR